MRLIENSAALEDVKVFYIPRAVWRNTGEEETNCKNWRQCFNACYGIYGPNDCELRLLKIVKYYEKNEMRREGGIAEKLFTILLKRPPAEEEEDT